MTATQVMNGGSENYGHPWKQHEADFQLWISLVTSGNQESKAELDKVVNKFYITVVRSAARLISSPSFRWLRLCGEDIANSWYLDLVATGFKGYDRGRPFYRYGHKLLVRKCLNIRRHEKYRLVKTGEERAGWDDNPYRIAETRDSIRKLKGVMPQISEAERNAMLRKYVDKEPSKTIAPDFDKSVGGFNRWTFDIRNRLRNLLDDDQRRESA